MVENKNRSLHSIIDCIQGTAEQDAVNVNDAIATLHYSHFLVQLGGAFVKLKAKLWDMGRAGTSN